MVAAVEELCVAARNQKGEGGVEETACTCGNHGVGLHVMHGNERLVELRAELLAKVEACA